MCKIFVIFAILLLTISETCAYSIKVYDEYGNRVGTYRKNGDSYEFYDFNDKKVDSPDMIIEDAPDKKTLTQYSQTFYDENMVPIGAWKSGFYGNDGIYYPGYSEFYSPCRFKSKTPYIVRPRVNGINEKLHNDYQYADYKNNVNYSDSRYPKFHKFENY